MDDDPIERLTQAEAIRKLRELTASVDPDRSLVDELLAERRAGADADNA